jgi:uncharacterized C2H2 Zn-finger protein
LFIIHRFQCPSCKKTFTRRQNLDRHRKKHADENIHHCPECLRVFTMKEELDKHFVQHDNQSGGGRMRSLAGEQDNIIGHTRQKLTP